MHGIDMTQMQDPEFGHVRPVKGIDVNCMGERTAVFFL